MKVAPELCLGALKRNLVKAFVRSFVVAAKFHSSSIRIFPNECEWELGWCGGSRVSVKVSPTGQTTTRPRLTSVHDVTLSAVVGDDAVPLGGPVGQNVHRVLESGRRRTHNPCPMNERIIIALSCVFFSLSRWQIGCSPVHFPLVPQSRVSFPQMT